MADKLLIGTDEAGYGPSLGPLVISATLWRLPADVDSVAMWDLLEDVLTSQPEARDRRLFIADSKKVYSPTGGLVDLETGVLSALASLGIFATTVEDLGALIGGPSFRRAFRCDPAISASVCSLPVAGFPDEINEFSDALKRAWQTSGIQLLAIRSRVVFPAEFNSLVAAADSKGTVLSQCTLQLIHDVREHCSPHTLEPKMLQVICDKHGGRNRYDGLISRTFNDQLVFRLEESTRRSRYRMGSAEFLFRTEAEQFLPVALASMVSKYLRELLMICFNDFWKQHLPDLRPTKGYPLDARRFREQIAETAVRLGITDEQFWRSR